MKLQVMWDLDMITKAGSLTVNKERNGTVAFVYFLSATADHICRAFEAEMPLPEPSDPFSASLHFQVNLDHSCKSG